MTPTRFFFPTFFATLFRVKPVTYAGEFVKPLAVLVRPLLVAGWAVFVPFFVVTLRALALKVCASGIVVVGRWLKVIRVDTAAMRAEFAGAACVSVMAVVVKLALGRHRTFKRLVTNAMRVFPIRVAHRELSVPVFGECTGIFPATGRKDANFGQQSFFDATLDLGHVGSPSTTCFGAATLLALLPYLLYFSSLGLRRCYENC